MNSRPAKSFAARIKFLCSTRLHRKPNSYSIEALEVRQLLSSQVVEELKMTEEVADSAVIQAIGVYDYPSVSNELGETILQQGIEFTTAQSSVEIEARGRIVARIRDTANEPLEGARVTLRGNGNYRSLVTDSRGIVVMTQLRAGTYEVQAEKSGVGVSLNKQVVLNSDRSTEFPTIKVPGVRLLINNVESLPNPVQLLDTVRFRYHIFGDDSLATNVVVEGRLIGRENWETVATEDASRIESGNTLIFKPRMIGDFEFRVRVEHNGHEYTSRSTPLTVDYRSFSHRDVTRDRRTVSAMKSLWNRTKTFAYAHRATGGRREFAFAIYYDTATGRLTRGRFAASEIVTGMYQPKTDSSFVFPDTSSWSTSPNGTMTYLVGIFHTHTPMTYAPPRKTRRVGPSSPATKGTDTTLIEAFAKHRNRTILGFVYDYHGQLLECCKGKRIRSGHPLNDPARIWNFQGNP